MKQFYFTLVFLGCTLFVAGQNLGGIPVDGLISISEIIDPIQTTNNTNKISQTTTSSATSLSIAAPIAPTGDSTEVGITEGQLSVSLTGGANYAIPIAVPPGINGVVPQVSLAYNSQGGNGMAGYGWNISGVSAITRIPRTQFHDGVVGGVNLDTNDRFALDGQRLILKSGVYGAAGAVYETENFSNIKITSLGVSPLGATYGPASFLVEYPDGSTAEYGSTTNSRSISSWSITYWQNAQSVRISYTYILANNNLSIEYIKYGNTSTLTPINEIKFVYKARQRPEQAYLGGQSILTNTILSEIQVSGNSVGFRNYILEYNTTSLGYQRLESITEKSGDTTKSYNPTVFSYEDTADVIPSVNWGSFENLTGFGTVNIDINGNRSSNIRTVTGDFFGDEKMDFLIYNTQIVGEYWLASDIQMTNQNTAIFHNVGAFEHIFAFRGLNQVNKLETKQGWAVVKKTDTNYTFSIYSRKNETNKYLLGNNDLQYVRVVDFPKISNAVVQKKIISGDFNSDGLTDVIAIDNNSSSRKVYYVDLKRENTTNFLTYSGEILNTISSSTKIEVADVNGDGKSDIMIFENGKVTSYTLNSVNQLLLLWDYSDTSISIDSSKTILLGDYNGDGKTDFLIPTGFNSDQWTKYSSTGINFFKEVQTYPGLPYIKNSSSNDFNYIPSEYDKDGKTDIIVSRSFTTMAYTPSSPIVPIQVVNITIWCYKNREGKFSSTNSITRTSPYFENIKFPVLPIFLPTGKGFQIKDKPYNPSLEIAFLSNSSVFYFTSEKDNSKDQLLRTITTGNGVKESITYQPLTSDSKNDINESIYTASSLTENYPQSDIESAITMPVVTKLEKQSATVYKKQLFSYYGAVSNMEGLGFLGFRATMRTNWHDDTTPIISTITKTDVNLRGAGTESFTVLGFSNANKILAPTDPFISRSVNNYNMVNGVFENPLQTNKVFKLKLTNSKQINGLDNTSAETTAEFDSYNNPLTSTTLLKEDENTVQTTVSTIVYKPVVTTLPYLIGIPASKTETVTVNNDVMTSEELYTYSTSNLLTVIKKKGTGTPYVTETNTYSTFGSIVTKVITATGITRTATYAYDTSKRFIIKATDVKGLITNYIYYPDNGLLKSETNHYGQTTSYLYDPWFKRTTTTNYLGKTNTLAYTRQNEKTLITSTGGDDGSYSEELYDDLGRKIRTGIKDIQGNMSFKEYQYDIYDRNFSVSEPFTTAPTQWNSTQYDVYGRPIAATNFTGKTISVLYDKLTTTTTDSSTGKTKDSTKNAMGNVVKVVETPTGGNPQTVDYNYYANGNLKETNYNNSKIAISQDGWGRKTSLADPSAGLYSYTYNDIGEIVTETTPNGTTTYTYDARGNITKKVILGNNTSSNTVYTFNATTRLLTKSVYTDVLDASKKITTLYTYDLQGRLVTTNETTGYGAVFTKTVSYDAWGRADIETSTASLAVKTSTTSTQNTYKNGFAYQIKDYPNTKTLWETSEVNARGQLTKAKLGNGIEINNLYDTYGYITKTKHDLLTNNILEFDTDFNTQRGNLNWRKNSLFKETLWDGENQTEYTIVPQENFTYDSQDRLISYPDAQGNIVTQTYKADGRIETNTLGTYNYTKTDKVYQNTSITLDPEDASYYANREGIFSDGMEGKKNWSIEQNSRFNYDPIQKHFGNTSLNIDNTYSEPGQTLQINSNVWTPIDNVVATQYTISAWVLSNQNAVPRIYIATDVVSGLNSFATTTVKNQWVRIEATYLVPANVKKLSLSIGNFGDGNVWFDDVMIRKTANTPLVNLQIPDATYKDRQLVIDYNTFKSPVNITEAGVDKLSFTYNENNDRSMMFYGSLDANKALRPLRKYYSADGSMEIKATFAPGNTTTPTSVEFVTYIGGDGYSAPVVVKSDGITQSYLYLHRDYQGSILAITNNDGVVLEKRKFDAWGSLIQLEQNGVLTPLPSGGAGGGLVLLLDRGYTGHEHLQSVGLINMNGRLYDPKLHRFLQPDNFVQDPSNTQNYNRYGYCWNNPLKYTDPSGEKIKFTFNDFVAGVQIVIGVGLMFIPSAQYAGAMLITNGFLHFKNAYDGYKKTGNWEYSSYNTLPFFSFGIETNIENGNYYKPNGITQNESLVKPQTIAINDVRAQGGGECPNCLNPSTTGHNLFYLTYPGGDNPKSYNGQYNYSYVPTNLSEYPAIGHDRRYDNLKITGALGLFTDTRAIGADWRFVTEELSIASNPFINPIHRMSAGVLGLGLGLSALPKTLFQMSKPFGYIETVMWYIISNQGVNNTPTIHKH